MIGLCADTIRDDGLHKALYHFFGERTTFVKASLNKPLKIYCIKTEFKAVMERKRDGKVDFNKVIDSLSYNSERNKLIADIAEIFYYHRTLILCKRVKQAEEINELLCEKGLQSALYCGTHKNISNFQILCSTIQKVERGFDLANAMGDSYDGMPITMVIYASSLTKPQQSVGRAFRSNNPSAIYLLDDNSILKSHWIKCEKYFKKGNTEIHYDFI